MKNKLWWEEAEHTQAYMHAQWRTQGSRCNLSIKAFQPKVSTVTCKCRTSANGIFFKWGTVKSWEGVCPKYAIWSCVAHCWTFTYHVQK